MAAFCSGTGIRAGRRAGQCGLHLWQRGRGQPHRRPAAGCAQGAPHLALSGRRGPLYGKAGQGGHARTLPAAGVHPEERLWLDAAAAAGKRARARAANRPESRTPVRPAGRQPRLPGCRAGRAQPQPGRGETTRPRACRVEGVRAGVFPGTGRTFRCGARGRAAAGALPSDRPACAAGRGIRGQRTKGRFVPEHHLFTAFGAQCANREELTLADPAVWSTSPGGRWRRAPLPTAGAA